MFLFYQCQPVSCGNVSLESSYEKVHECVYTSTLLYEYEGFGWKALTAKAPYFSWRLTYSEVCDCFANEMSSAFFIGHWFQAFILLKMQLLLTTIDGTDYILL